MSQKSELQTPDTTIHIADSSANSEQTIFGIGSNAIILIMLGVSFIPALLDTDFYQSVPRMVLMILLGCGYGLTAVYITRWHEQYLTWWSATVYFSIQTAIILALMALSDGINDNFWLLMLPLVGQGFSVGVWRGALTVTAVQLLMLGSYLIIDNRTNLSPNLYREIFNILLSIASAMFFVMLFTYLALREGIAREEASTLATDLHQANQRLAAYAAQVEELATMRERNRLAREIHDNLGHYLTVVNVQIEAARTVMAKNPDKADDALIKAQRLTQEGLVSVRQSITALRESPWSGGSFLDGLNGLIEETQATGLAVSLTVNGEERPLSPKSALTLYRTVQEGLTNIRKHAQATAVAIELDYTPIDHLRLQIKDNGQGTASPEGGFGLIGLKERVSLLGGTVTINTQPDEGFELIVQLPIDEAQRTAT